ncbi:MAG: 23S rRNA (uracil-5-)-methyltransferase RumA [Caldithrix sp. RBG_13_44_9]|nr:MAG: 23S rRNA (uracil-5-)-methyltransferase RumA [Caldithrix sp. RBG_13_44_9]
MKKGQEIQVRVEKLAYGGQGIARFENQVIFIEGGIPGDFALARIQKIKQNYLQARLVKVIEPSPLRQDAPCRHFGFCGGCKWQNLDYSQQLLFKREQVIESLQHIADVSAEVVHQTLPSPFIFGYRNKMEFSFTANRWLLPEELAQPEVKKGYALGLHVPDFFDRVMHIEKCWLQDDTMNDILKFAQEYFNDQRFSIFNLRSHKGLLRFLVIRKSFSPNQYMVNVVTFQPAFEALAEFARKLAVKFSNIASIINTVNPRYAQIAFGEEEHLLHGKPVITEKIGPFEFDISANSFFQTNSLQAENLYRTVRDYVGSGHQLILDLYSGTGTIALFLSSQAVRVVGFELIEGALQDAYENCQRNKIKNCEFIAGEIRQTVLTLNEQPEVIVCDPPRGGMHPEVVKELLRIHPEKIIYVSCNPTTMARDVKMLLPLYRLKEVQPVDMFPHTYHIELVVKLERM